MKEYQSVQIAKEQLESALRLFLESDNYFSVITLAGAAEEILGKACREQGIRNSLEDMQHTYFLLNQIRRGEDVDRKALDKWVYDRANHARNKSKHINPIQEPSLEIDTEEEAKDLLNRALDNYWSLGNPFTDIMLEYHNNVRNV